MASPFGDRIVGRWSADVQLLDDSSIDGPLCRPLLDLAVYLLLGDEPCQRIWTLPCNNNRLGRKESKKKEKEERGGGGRVRRLLSIVPDSGRLTEWLQQRFIRIGVIE